MLTINIKWQTLTFKGFLCLAGWRSSSPVFFHWGNERILSEFICLGPLADATTGLVCLINQSFHLTRGAGYIFRNKTVWFPSCFWSCEWFWTQQHACGLIDQCWGWCQGVLLGWTGSTDLIILGFQHALLQSGIWYKINVCVFNQTLCI